MDVALEIQGILFRWDREKALANLRKHEVSFTTACEAFFDPFIRLQHSETVGGEERETAIGMTKTWALLVMVYTLRADSVRIISARRATAQERRTYEDQ